MPAPHRLNVDAASMARARSEASAPSEDKSAPIAQEWLTRHAEHHRLAKRWQQIESRLFKEHKWPKLAPAQRRRFPEQQQMDDLTDRMGALHAKNRALLASLASLAATSPTGICGKLAVAAAEVRPEENEAAHRLIVSILRDYRALHGG